MGWKGLKGSLKNWKLFIKSHHISFGWNFCRCGVKIPDKFITQSHLRYFIKLKRVFCATVEYTYCTSKLYLWKIDKVLIRPIERKRRRCVVEKHMWPVMVHVYPNVYCKIKSDSSSKKTKKVQFLIGFWFERINLSQKMNVLRNLILGNLLFSECMDQTDTIV